MRFERLIQEGPIQNGKLYYNLGNTYFLMKDLGKAILNYRRAERYLPYDTNLRKNLEFALRQRPDQIEEKPKTKVLKTLLFWYYDLPQWTRTIVFVVTFMAFWLGAAVRLFFRKAMSRWTLGCFGIVAVFFFTSLLVDSMMMRENPAGVIIAQEVLARKGDGLNYQRSFKEPLHAGTEFYGIANRNGWFHIELHDGRRGWIPKNTAELVW